MIANTCRRLLHRAMLYCSLTATLAAGACGCAGQSAHGKPQAVVSSPATTRPDPLNLFPAARPPGESDGTYFLRRTCGYERTAYVDAGDEGLATMTLDPASATCTLSSQHGKLVIRVIATAPEKYFSSLKKSSREELKLFSRPAVLVSPNRVVVLGTEHAYDVRLDGETPTGGVGRKALLSLAGFVVQTEHADKGLVYVRAS